jgi:hypothetical protein
MTRNTLFALILAALVAAPSFAQQAPIARPGGVSVAVTGDLRNASEVTTSAHSVGAPGSTHRRHLMTVDTGPADVLLTFTGEILPDGSVRVESRDGSVAFVRPGDAVRIRARFTCPRPGGSDPCGLLVVMLEAW